MNRNHIRARSGSMACVRKAVVKCLSVMAFEEAWVEKTGTPNFSKRFDFYKIIDLIVPIMRYINGDGQI